MDAVHLHLLLSHVPVLAAVFAALLLAYSFLRKSEDLRLLALVILVFAALTTIPVYLSGEPAEELIENLAGVSHDIVEEHEESAELALIFVLITGAAALAAIFSMRFKKDLTRWLVLLSLVLSVATAGLFLRTANLGGQVRHSEIRDGTAAAQQQPEKETKRDNDDD